MLARMCHKLPWRKMLVIIVHGLSAMTNGINPRDRIRSGTIRMTIYSITFIPIKTHRGVKL